MKPSIALPIWTGKDNGLVCDGVRDCEFYGCGRTGCCCEDDQSCPVVFDKPAHRKCVWG